MTTAIKKLTRFLPSSFHYKSLTTDTYKGETISEDDVNSCYDNFVFEEDEVNEKFPIEIPSTQVKKPFEKKYLLKAKINALEEYVDHLEQVIKDQELYIEHLETRMLPVHKRRLSY